MGWRNILSRYFQKINFVRLRKAEILINERNYMDRIKSPMVCFVRGDG
jgi:hypothetical protein